MKFVFNVFKLALQFFFKIISFTVKPFKYLILFLIIILFFSSSKVSAQVVPVGNFVYFYYGSLSQDSDCSRYFTDFDTAFIYALNQSKYKVPDRFYYSAEYLFSRNNVFNPVAGNKKCQSNFISESINLTRVELQVLARDKISNSSGSFVSSTGQSWPYLTIYAFYAKITDFPPSCNSYQENLYAGDAGGKLYSFCKNQQLRYSNQSCLMKYQNVVDVYYEKTKSLNESTELTSYIDDISDPSKTAMCRLSHKLKYKEDRNCFYKQYFYNGLHHDQGSVLNGDIVPVDLVDYQSDACSYILSPSYNPPTPDWNPDDEIPNLGEIGSAFDSNKDYDGDGQVGTDSDLRWCIENEFGCRVCLDGNCEAWPPGGSGGGGSGGGGSGGGTDPTDPVDCDLTPDDPACSENPPVNCDLYPTHSSCVEEPPVDCEKNPTDPTCPVKPVDCEKNPTDPSCPTKPVEPPKYGGPCVDTKSYTAPDGSMVIGISCGVESWYKSKYPDGLKSAFETHINKVKSSNSPIYSIAKYFDFKNNGSTTYPVFSFDLSLLGLDNHSIDMSNLYGFNFWNILKIMVLALFGFAAFRIAFGG